VKIYNKILNQRSGNDGGLFLGYKSNSIEYVLKKDQTSFFHIPFFSSTLSIHDSTLIADGAVGGPIPAMADRVMRFRGGYENTTPWGPASDDVVDGVWYGTWLYEDPQTKKLVWMDRFYNPGRLAPMADLNGGTTDLEVGAYIPNGDVYRDVKSTMLFLSGGYYQYFHVGENKMSDVIKTFSGKNGDKLTLYIHPSSSTLTSNYPVYTSQPPIVLEETSKELINTSYVNLNDGRPSISVPYDEKYNTPEFTLSMWVRNSSWKTSTLSLLAGNYNDGGFGILNNHTPETFHYVLPETAFGHILYFNQEGRCYLDQSARINNNLTTKPNFLFTNDLGDTWCISTTNVSVSSVLLSVYKLNYNGASTAIARNRSGDPIAFAPSETVISAKLDKVENLHLITSSFYYIFNKELLLQSRSVVPSGTLPCLYFNAAGNIQINLNARQAGIFNDALWILRPNGDLRVSGAVFRSNVEKFLRGPDDNLWVLHNKTALTVFDKDTLGEISSIRNIGENTSNEFRSFSFHYGLNEEHEWRCVIISSAKQLVYYFNMRGELIEVQPFKSFIDYTKAPEDEDDLSYSSDIHPMSDWSGYEWKAARGFNGLEILLSSKDHRLASSVFNRTERIPIVATLEDNVWLHLALKTQNKKFEFLVNGIKVSTFNMSPSVDISYNKKNSFYYGSFPGKNAELRAELATNSLIFNGHLGDLNLYNYPLKEEYMGRFFLGQWRGQDIIWNLPTSNLNYVEEINRFYQHRFPPSKSKAYKIKISGHNMQSNSLRAYAEHFIRAKVAESEPAYADLLEIEWTGIIPLPDGFAGCDLLPTGEPEEEEPPPPGEPGEPEPIILLEPLSLSETVLEINQPYTIDILGATENSEIDISDGELPPGMALNSEERTITGTPTLSGQFDFEGREILAIAANSPLITPLSLIVEPETVTEPCGQSFAYSGYQGEFTYNVSLGTDTGTVTMAYDAYSIPDRFVVQWNGTDVIDTGFRGWSSYNNQLPSPVTGPGLGQATFEKTAAFPTTAQVTVYAPLGGTAWQVAISCPGQPLPEPEPNPWPTTWWPWWPTTWPTGWQTTSPTNPD